MESKLKAVRTYVRPNGKSPFESWFSELKDNTLKARIITRIDRLRLGNLGDFKSVGHGVFELRIPHGPGIRIYFGMIRSEIVLLLLGGDKSSQFKDIHLAQKYWKEYTNAEN
jgi:putative addiction module killer protein